MLARVQERYPGLLPSDVRDLLVSARTHVPIGGRLPSVLLVGAQKAGTTSLHRILAKQAGLKPGVRKELAYLNRPSAIGGAGHYARRFPVSSRFRLSLTFESSTQYLCDPFVPERASRIVPDAIVVVILRRPSDRALSHYDHNARHGIENLTFENALEAEATRCDTPLRYVGGETFRDEACHEYAYAGNGRYREALVRWSQNFDATRIVVATFDVLETDPASIVESIRTLVGSNARGVRLLERRYNANPSCSSTTTAATPLLRELDDEYQRIASAISNADSRGVAVASDLMQELGS
jgi:hypothetical protein